MYREHLSKFEIIRDSLEAGELQPDDLTDIRDEIDNFIDNIKSCYSEMDFDIYERDILERHIRIPKLRDLYERKRENLKAFQNGKDLWKNREYRRY